MSLGAHGPFPRSRTFNNMCSKHTSSQCPQLEHHHAGHSHTQIGSSSHHQRQRQWWGHYHHLRQWKGARDASVSWALGISFSFNIFFLTLLTFFLQFRLCVQVPRRRRWMSTTTIIGQYQHQNEQGSRRRRVPSPRYVFLFFYFLFFNSLITNIIRYYVLPPP